MKKTNFLLGIIISLLLLNSCDPNPNGHADYVLYGPTRNFDIESYESHPDSFQWNVFGYDLEYDIYMDTVNPPKMIVAHWKKNVYYDATVEPNKDYYWQVAARDTVENQYAISPVWHFSSGNWAHIPNPTDSSVIDTPYITFSWAFRETYFYQFQFYLDEIGNNPDTSGIDSLRIFTRNKQIFVGPLKNNTTYKWQIRWGDSLFNWSDSRSKKWTFTTQY